jgi:DNA ligase-1
MRTAADVVLALEAVGGRLEKEAIVRQAWNAGITDFFQGAVMAYSAFITFGVKKVPLIQAEDDGEPSKWQWADFKALAQNLEQRKLTGHAARDALKDAAEVASIREWNGFYRRVLLQDLKCGVTDSTINKVLAEFGSPAESYMVPEFSCQLAKNGDDHPKKMRGPKLLDPKLDGVRILTICDKENGTVSQHSRNGKINENFPQIVAAMTKLLPKLTVSMVFDGEMVSRSFQALMKQLNRKDAVDTSDAKLALFDCLPLKDFMAGECKMTQIDRHEALAAFQPVFEQLTGGSVYVIPKLSVNLDTAEGQATFKEFNRETVEAGYEGIMVKDPQASYQTKRTDAWMKIKPFITVDLEIVGFEPGKPESKFANTLGGLVCRGTDQGKLIEVTVGGGYTEELRDQIWAAKHKLLGFIVEVKGDALTLSQGSDDVWSLRFPVFMQFRGWEPGEKI